MLNTFTFNGHTSNEFGIRIERMPALNRPARKFRAASVPGRNGNIYEFEDAWEEIIQPYEIFAGGMNNGDAVSSFASILEWLHSANGYAVLSDTYDSTHYRMAAFVDSADIESMWHTWGRMVVNFRCRPERYLTGQTSAVASGAVINNTTKHIAKPVITLTGGGVTSKFKMTGRTMKVVSKVVYGTAQLYTLIPDMNANVWMICRDTPTEIKVAGTSYGTLTSLTEGALEYEITQYTYNGNWGVGFVIRVNPDTDYTLSWEAYNDGRVEVWFANQTGYNDIIGSVFKETAPSDWVDDYITFHTPQECGYILISLGHIGVSTPAKTSQKYRNVMLNTGTTAETFRAYTTPTISTLKIKNTTLQLSTTGFKTAIVDCDRENVEIDGADSNQNATLLDQYGNTSEDFLQLAKGNNTITYNGDITACSIDTKMWNL